MKEKRMVRVHLSLNKDNKTCYRYTAGNPNVKSQVELVNFYDLSPLNMSGFLRYLFVKGAKVPETIGLVQLFLVNNPLGIIRNDFRYQQVIAVLMSDQHQADFSVYYHQYKSYILGL